MKPSKKLVGGNPTWLLELFCFSLEVIWLPGEMLGLREVLGLLEQLCIFQGSLIYPDCRYQSTITHALSGFDKLKM